ncbi:hypothetical protein, conserved [Trypanosoma cruzi]|uniref:RING-type domain-containing protein n=2 Tax=Trypanosoma cruzi TaxID=5693 RepID=Q4E1T1_TRYCC|nr:hypothetical protein, conserved [Trypanosoma cruzi]EAN98722.1 hypothetical protein, conserved [Trypanosoma cruzi]|eukprot:XP_820573.1 hypothetical protein [Trypanosoma cruzi strain CL Brener]
MCVVRRGRFHYVLKSFFFLFFFFSFIIIIIIIIIICGYFLIEFFRLLSWCALDMYFCYVCQQFRNQHALEDVATNCEVCQSPIIEIVRDQRHYNELQAIVGRQQEQQQENQPGNFLAEILHPLWPRLAENLGEHIVIQFTIDEGPETSPRPCVSVDDLIGSFVTLPNGLQESDRLEYPEAFVSSSCPICLDSIVGSGVPVVILPCRHCFHKNCIREWLREHPECPLCRAFVVPSQDTVASQ